MEEDDFFEQVIERGSKSFRLMEIGRLIMNEPWLSGSLMTVQCRTRLIRTFFTH